MLLYIVRLGCLATPHTLSSSRSPSLRGRCSAYWLLTIHPRGTAPRYTQTVSHRTPQPSSPIVLSNYSDLPTSFDAETWHVLESYGWLALLSSTCSDSASPTSTFFMLLRHVLCCGKTAFFLLFCCSWLIDCRLVSRVIRPCAATVLIHR
ncbi:uncharacterized protein BDV17DRAFT_109640 [Aspergillus undulatus]|uniref:uncharacterized protein n=1 Tax=Aspergillus undulatus TaxID=1810928 RepID=UPI003CCCEAA0